MANFNRVMLMGNLTRDPELRYIPSGQAVSSFTVAVNRRYRVKETSEFKEETTFIPVVVWAKQAENCGKYLSKGSPVFIEGRISARTWEDSGGNRKTKFEIIATRVQFLSKITKTSEEPPSEEGENETEEKSNKDEIPF